MASHRCTVSEMLTTSLLELEVTSTLVLLETLPSPTPLVSVVCPVLLVRLAMHLVESNPETPTSELDTTWPLRHETTPLVLTTPVPASVQA
jgi:hypothetical protein